MREKEGKYIMLKPELVIAIQAELKDQGIEVSRDTVKAHLSAFETVVTTTLPTEDVKIKGFVDFTSKAVEAGEARNPATGEKVAVPAHRKAKASLAKGLRKF